MSFLGKGRFSHKCKKGGLWHKPENVVMLCKPNGKSDWKYTYFIIFEGYYFKEKFQELTNQNSTLTIDDWKEQVESCKQENEDLASKVEILTNQCSSMTRLRRLLMILQVLFDNSHIVRVSTLNLLIFIFCPILTYFQNSFFKR